MNRAAPFIVAIDGPAASGKGTLARRIARHFGFAHLETGALYRAAAFLLLSDGGDPHEATATAAARRVDAALLADPRLREERVGEAASLVAAFPGVRAAFLAFQRGFAAHPPPPARGAVLDGRDIGTIVCPDAAVKLFVTASVETRARRRLEQLRQDGVPAIYDAVLQDMTQRDTRDTGRRDAPLMAAPDAVCIDTTGLDADAVFAQARTLVERAYRGPR